VSKPIIGLTMGDAAGIGPELTVRVFEDRDLLEEARKGSYDGVLVMYHDQGNIAVKLLNFGSGVTVVYGLPIIRTSVAHGTAFDIAGNGVALPETLIEVVRTAANLARIRKKIE